jgi:hypothetical protein
VSDNRHNKRIWKGIKSVVQVIPVIGPMIKAGMDVGELIPNEELISVGKVFNDWQINSIIRYRHTRFTAEF